MDWAEIVDRYRQKSARSTAELIAARHPELGTAEGIRRKREFILAWDNKPELILPPNYQPLPVDPVAELLEYKCQQYQKRKAKAEEESVTTVAVGAKPIAIVHFGDPHLDDPGCDLPLLREQIRLIQNTSGVWGGNIGDTINNWTGKLAKLYAKQSTTFEEALTLAEWFAHAISWLYWVLGNHDHWDNGGTILRLLLRGAEVKRIAAYDARIQLQFDNGVSVRVRARHDWKGRSLYDPAHGAKRGHFFGDRWADLAVGGHTHEWALWQGETEDGHPRWAAKIRGYKRLDDFAEEKGFYSHKHGAALLTIIDPYAVPTERVQCYWDVSYGLKMLELLRSSR